MTSVCANSKRKGSINFEINHISSSIQRPPGIQELQVYNCTYIHIFHVIFNAVQKLKYLNTFISPIKRMSIINPGFSYFRKNQSNMGKEEKVAFIYAYNTINEFGDLGNLALYHTQNHKMHGFQGTAGAQRFLPWHRIYLAYFERILQSVDPRITLPYWNWTVDRDIPDWLKNITPTVNGPDPNFFPISVTRNPGPSSALPPISDVDIVMSTSNYTEFEDCLENGNQGKHKELQTAMHNTVHQWVGGTMVDPAISPADPLFWMHHANLDRIWSEWQVFNKNQNPILNGSDTKMDPWTDINESDTRNIQNFGYSYPLYIIQLSGLVHLQNKRRC